MGKRAVRYFGDFLLKLLKAFRLHSCFASSQSPVVSFLLVPASTADPVQLRKGGTLNPTERATFDKFNNKDLFSRSLMIRLCDSTVFSAHLQRNNCFQSVSQNKHQCQKFYTKKSSPSSGFLSCFKEVNQILLEKHTGQGLFVVLMCGICSTRANHQVQGHRIIQSPSGIFSPPPLLLYITILLNLHLGNEAHCVLFIS